jgi:hypothetical protein
MGSEVQLALRKSLPWLILEYEMIMQLLSGGFIQQCAAWLEASPRLLAPSDGQVGTFEQPIHPTTRHVDDTAFANKC